MINLNEYGLILTDAPSAPVCEQIFRLRVAAWREKMSISPSVIRWEDAIDCQAWHWAILAGGQPVAAARFTIHNEVCDVPDAECLKGVVSYLPPPIGSINRCVVHPDYRGMGLSGVLDEVRLAAAKQLDCRSIVATVSDAGRAKALQSYGFQYMGNGLPYPDGIVKDDLNIVYVAYLARSRGREFSLTQITSSSISPDLS